MDSTTHINIPKEISFSSNKKLQVLDEVVKERNRLIATGQTCINRSSYVPNRTVNSSNVVISKDWINLYDLGIYENTNHSNVLVWSSSQRKFLTQYNSQNILRKTNLLLNSGHIMHNHKDYIYWIVD